MDNLPKRKSIRIKDFDYSTPGAYFITVCTANREKVFWSDCRGELCSPVNVPLSDIGVIADAEIKKLSSIYDAVRPYDFTGDETIQGVNYKTGRQTDLVKILL